MSFQKVFLTGVVGGNVLYSEEDGLLFQLGSVNTFIDSTEERVTQVSLYDVALRNPVGKRLADVVKHDVRVALVGELFGRADSKGNVYPRIDVEGVPHLDIETYNLNILSIPDMPEFEGCTDLQAVVVAGNLGKDADMRYTTEAVPVSGGSIAANTKKGDEKKTYWFNWSAWRNLAEIAVKWFTRGKFLIFLGRFTLNPETGRPRTWTTQEGDVRSGYEITVDSFGFGSGKGGDGNGGLEPMYQAQENEQEVIPF
jgi:single-strand DNA-binding protein